MAVTQERGSESESSVCSRAKYSQILALLDAAACPDDMDLPKLFLHPLKGNHQGTWSVTVRANWRVTFRFVNKDVEIVNYEDYH
ncbi:MAG: killer protein [Gammaproteobacteria bacterium]|nr:killer protein [Gammaproteobacteria bacterium]